MTLPEDPPARTEQEMQYPWYASISSVAKKKSDRWVNRKAWILHFLQGTRWWVFWQSHSMCQPSPGQSEAKTTTVRLFSVLDGFHFQVPGFRSVNVLRWMFEENQKAQVPSIATTYSVCEKDQKCPHTVEIASCVQIAS